MRSTRSSGHRTRAALVLVLVVVAALAATARPQPAHAQRADVEVVLGSISPVLTKGGTLQATGTVTNTGDVDLTTMTAAVWVSLVPLESRTALAAAAAEAPGDRLGDRITEPADLVDELTDSLAPGASVAFRVSVPIERLGLTSAGVYPVGVDIRANPTDESRDTVGRVRTFAPYLPKPAASGTVDVAFVAPFADSPATLADGSLLDDSLGAVVAPTGRLGRLLDLATSSAVTPAVDPDLLAEAGDLASAGHQVTGPAPAEPGSDPGAVAFVAGMKALVGGRRTLVLPFADTDIVSLDHRNFTEPLTGLAALTTQDAGTVGLTGTVTAMPVDGYADAAALDTMAATGIRQVVLSADSLPDRAGETPRVTIPTDDGSVTAIVADPELLAGDTGGPDGALRQRQRFLAETALMALATPKGSTYRVVAAMPRDQRVTATTSQIVRPPAAATWVRAQPLDKVAVGPSPRYVGTLRYPAAVRDDELAPGLVGAVRLQSQRSDALVDISTDKDAIGLLWRQAALRGTSVAWRDDAAGGQALVGANTGIADDQLGQVKVSAPSLVTLSGSSGSFPVTVNNELHDPVRRLRAGDLTGRDHRGPERPATPRGGRETTGDPPVHGRLARQRRRPADGGGDDVGRAAARVRRRFHRPRHPVRRGRLAHPRRRRRRAARRRGVPPGPRVPPQPIVGRR